MTETPVCSIVQFPHPGGERFPKPLQVGAELPWNTGTHGRKFLVSAGTWSDRTGRSAGNGDLMFWGEWEAQSHVVEVLPGHGSGMPRALQAPWFSVTDTGWRQNSDPLVFGDAFAYTNCRQPKNLKLRRLAPGSVIVFGSKLHDNFVLDTVVAVADATPYRPVDGPPAGANPAAQALITDPLALDPKVAGTTLTWYRGATPDAPVEGMFSFVPALPHRSGSAGFARPRIKLDDKINSQLAMAARHTPVHVEAAQQAWHRIVDQVLDAGLVLGTHLPTPKQVTAGDPQTVDRTAGGC